jgi:lipoprotein-anchoring transpeptidase ErfK/SrfK
MPKFRLIAVLAAALFLGFTAQAMAQGQVKFNFTAQEWSMDPKYKRTEVSFETDEKPGTVIIRTAEKRLYLVLPDGKALRYGIGVGRDGFRWSGVERVTRKAEWPGWTPPPEMRKREPHLPVYMEGGPDNPLGARALYLGSTIYRIHGTAQPWTIGMNVSSGCIRLQNEDVIHLYERVKVGAKVIVE